MQLKSLTIKNFKGIGEEGLTVNFAPVTLLFGANNSGKSSIIQALHFVHEVICNNNLNPHSIKIYGQSISLGGFKNFVHKHEIDREIVFKIEVDFSMYKDGMPFTHINGEWIREFDPYWAMINSITSSAIEIGIKWDNKKNETYISSYATYLNNKRFVRLEHVELGYYNFSGCNPHAFMTDKDIEQLQSLATTQQKLTDYKKKHDDFLKKMDSYFPIILWNFVDFKKFFQEFNIKNDDFLNSLPPFFPTDKLSFRTSNWNDFLFSTDDGWWYPQDIISDVRSAEDFYLDDIPENVIIHTLLAQLILGPAFLIAKSELKFLEHIGGSRPTPSRFFMADAHLDNFQNDNLSIWKILTEKPLFTEAVNKDLAKIVGSDFEFKMENILDTSFSLEELTKNINKSIARGDTLNASLLSEIIIKSGTGLRNRLVFKDKNGTILNPCDLGRGVSQIIPILALLRNEFFSAGKMCCVEEPEANIHPAWQVELGDFFLQIGMRDKDAGFSPTIILETHSEHIMLRLLRRIRETYENELPLNATPATKNDVAVHYVQKNLTGCTEIVFMEITDDGDFSQQWPKGFFEERMGEIL